MGDQGHAGKVPGEVGAAIKILAECRTGELLKQVERGQGKKGSGLRVTLTQSEIAEPTARRWQTMAPLAEQVRDLEAEKTEAGEELTSGLIYTLAKTGVHFSTGQGEGSRA